MAADAVYALTNSLAASTKISGAVKSFTEQRNRLRRPIDNATHITALDHDLRAQIDEIFLVLALLGEALLPLNVFDIARYPETLADVEASILSGGHDLMPMAFGELSAELQYAVTSGLAFCSCFAPMPVYRGFGAAVLNDWDWGCPDRETVVKRMKAKTSVWTRMITEKQDPQPNRPILEAFDQVVQMLQVKQVAFLSVRPSVSGFAAEQPRFAPRKEKEVKRELHLCEEWSSKIGKLGHPSPSGKKVSTWAMPYSTWTSSFSCQLLKTKDSFETIMLNQMDPGRLLHAFVCRQNLDVGENQLLVLPSGSPAEALACWLEDLPGMTHKILKWSDLDTELFERKCGKSLRKQLGHYPLPERFVMRDPNVRAAQRPSVPSLPTSPGTEGIASPPPYSPDRQLAIMDKPVELANEEVPAAVELATSSDPVELDAPVSHVHAMDASATAASKPARQIHHAASTGALLTSKNLPVSVAEGVSTLRSLTTHHGTSISEGVSTLRSLTGVRRKSATDPSPRHPSALAAGLPPVPPKILERPVSAIEASRETDRSSKLMERPVVEYKHEPMMDGINVVRMPDAPPTPRTPVQAPPLLDVPSVVISMPDEDVAELPAELSAEVPGLAELPSHSSDVVYEEATSAVKSAPLDASKDVVKKAVARKELPRKEVPQSHELERAQPPPGSPERPASTLRRESEIDTVADPTSTVDATTKEPESGATASNEASTPTISSTDTYLDLLNKVARGEISPQALQRILLGGDAMAATTLSTDTAKT